MNMPKGKNRAGAPNENRASARSPFYLSSAPETVTWELTYNCNLRCLHCSTTQTPCTQINTLGLEEKLTIIDRLKSAKVFRVALSGGEPLLDPHFDIIANKLLRSDFFDILLTTNGLLLDANRIRKLRKIGIKRIQVSLDGASAFTHDYIRGERGVFNKVINNLKKLNGDFNLTINTVVLKLNYSELPYMLKLVKSLKVTTWRMVLLVPVSNFTLDLQITPEEFKQLVIWTEKMKKGEKNIHIVGPTFKLQPNVQVLDGAIKSDRLYCEAGITLCTIMADGTIIPCTYFNSPLFYAGNIIHNGLEEIWRFSKILNVFRNLGTLPFHCKNCDIKDTCHGGCRAAAYYRYNSLTAMDPRCFQQ